MSKITGPSPSQAVSTTHVDPKLREAAEGMEAMFLDYLMQVMQNSVPNNEMDMESGATKIYRSMLNSELAKQAARSGGVGLAEQIIANVNGPSYNERAPQDGAGGFHEGQSVQR